MNEMELLRELAQETPLPAPAELDAVRARLVAAIATESAAGRLAAAPEPTAGQPHPAGGQPAEPPRPSAPAPVRDAVRLMYGGAAGTAAQLIIALFYFGNINDYHLTVGAHALTRAQLIHLRPLIATLVVVGGLVLIALWLWLARAVGRGRSWARVLSSVLFGLATLELAGLHSAGQVFWAMLTWLTGLAAVWQLWRPASSAYFTSVKARRSRPPSQISGP
jgi:hypothetical protein